METRDKKRKVESDFIQDSNSNKRFKANKNYCFLCQNYGHQLSASCSVNAVCFSCGVNGHVRKDCPALHVQNENTTMSTGIGTGDWIESAPQGQAAININIPIISQEAFFMDSTKNRETKALTLLARVATSEKVEYVRIIPRIGDGVKLVTGIHKCMGDQERNIGANNVFVTILIKHGQKTRNVKVGDTLGYAKLVGERQAAIFNTFFTITMKSGMSKLKLDKNVSLQQDETIVIEASVESIPSGNTKNYPIQFESTNKSLRVEGNGYCTIQKGNSAKVRIRNISEKMIILRNGDILGNAKSLITEEFIEKIQSSNDVTDESRESKSNSTPLSPDLPHNFVFLEIETLRASNSSAKQITQIGCCSEDLDKKFFVVIEPRELNHYLDNYQIAGDILQFLHLQKNESGEFEYRKQFEIVEEGLTTPKCISEREALQALAFYLDFLTWSNFILVSIKKETIELVIERMKHFEIDFSFLQGFCTWDSFLGKTGDNEMGPTHEFDDWYIEKVNNNVPSSLNAETVSSMHKEAINRHICEICFSISTSINPDNYDIYSQMILEASSPIEFLFTNNSAVASQIANSEEPPEFLELTNSFRPNFPTTITMISLETLEISSDEEEANVQTPLPSTSQLIQRGEYHELNNVQNVEPPQFQISQPSTDVMHIWISDDEPEEGIPSQNNLTESNETITPQTNAEPDVTVPSQPTITEPPPSNILQSSTSRDQTTPEIEYCLVCNKNLSKGGMKSHLMTSKKHRLRIEKVLSKVEKVLSKSCRHGISQEEDKQILWFDLKNRLSVLSIKQRVEVIDKLTEIENLTTIALLFECKAGLIVEYIEKELSYITLANRKQHVSTELMRFIGSLSRKNNTFKDMFKRHIAADFTRAYKMKVLGDLTDFIRLRLEWAKTRTFEVETLNDVDLEMRKHYPSWIPALSRAKW